MTNDGKSENYQRFVGSQKLSEEKRCRFCFIINLISDVVVVIACFADIEKLSSIQMKIDFLTREDAR